MASLVGSILLSSLVYLAAGKPAQSPPQQQKHEELLKLTMPGVQPQIKDTYLCYPTQVEEDSVYITGFEPVANSSTAHHMLLYGCEEPGDQEAVWNCGEMAAENPTYSVGPVCNDGAKIIYAWAMDAPDLKLPKGVAFKVGASTNIKWLVLQVHYKDVTSFLPPLSKKDHSGFFLETTEIPQPKRAGVYLLGTGGEIPAHSTVYMETACSITDPVTIHPFAFRAHTHSHGVVVSGYRVRDGQWTEVGHISPQKPQMFYNVSNPGMTIRRGDSVAARCTMVNNENKTVKIGATQEDEMCNFYVMYWVSGEEILPEEYCFKAGSPKWFWSDDEEIQSENAPANASIVPGTDQIVEATKAITNDVETKLDMTDEEMESQILKWLAMYDEEAFEEYMYNLLYPQQPNEYPQQPNEYPQQPNEYPQQPNEYPQQPNEYYNNVYQPRMEDNNEEGYYYNPAMSQEGYYPEEQVDIENAESRQENQVIAEDDQTLPEYNAQDLEALISRLSPEQLQQYYKQLQQAPM